MADTAELVWQAAQSSLQRAEAGIDDQPSLLEYMRAGSAEKTRQEGLENRVWAKYSQVRSSWEQSGEAVGAAHAASQQRQEELIRMLKWTLRPDRLTPFPWVGDQYIEPCNAHDLNYYEGRPDSYPDGVREWIARYAAYRPPECVCHGEHESVSCDVCSSCDALGTMRGWVRDWTPRGNIVAREPEFLGRV